MSDISLALQLDLALHLGLVAISTTLLMWRLGSAPGLIQQLKLLGQYRQSGFAPSRVVVLGYLRYAEGILKLLGLVFTCLLLWKIFEFFEVAERLVGPDSYLLDVGLYRRLWLRAERTTADAVQLTGLVVLLLLLDYGAGTVCQSLRSPISSDEIPSFSHAHVLPKRWRIVPEALWSQRVNHAVAGTPKRGPLRTDLEEVAEKGIWNADWVHWSKCVSGYRKLTAKDLAEG